MSLRALSTTYVITSNGFFIIINIVSTNDPFKSTVMIIRAKSFHILGNICRGSNVCKIKLPCSGPFLINISEFWDVSHM